MATKSTKKAAPKKAAKSTKKTPGKVAPKAKVSTKAKPAPATADCPAPVRERDPRLPRPGAILRREHKGKVIEIEVLDRGFKFDGRVWRSLSAIAREVTGTTWNGYLWANLQRRPTKPSKSEQATPADTTEAK